MKMTLKKKNQTTKKKGMRKLCRKLDRRCCHPSVKMMVCLLNLRTLPEIFVNTTSLLPCSLLFCTQITLSITCCSLYTSKSFHDYNIHLRTQFTSNITSCSLSSSKSFYNHNFLYASYSQVSLLVPRRPQEILLHKHNTRILYTVF